MSEVLEQERGRWPLVGLVVGPVLAIAVFALLEPQPGSALAPSGRAVAAVGVLMAVYWLTEALPVAATALLPLALVPLLSRGEIGIAAVAAPYGNEMIFLFMGGFMMALAMQRWGLHRRIALRIIDWVGDRPANVVLGFMIASAFLSMWISNTATAVMMLPIALSVIELVRQRVGDKESVRGSFPFAINLLLGTAYGASIGGTATLIGTPPNLMMAAFVKENFDREITFGAWLPFALPFACLLLPMTWWLLTRWVFPIRLAQIPGGRQLIRDEIARAGPMSRQERLVLVVFVVTALAWVFRSPLAALEVFGTRPLAGLSDAGIAIGAALVLFATPVSLRERTFLLDWPQAMRLPWGILLLFGGGLSLAAAVRTGGVDRWIGEQLSGFSHLPPLLIVTLVTGAVILLTEMTSNAATTATLLPILAASAEGLGIDPLRLVIPATLAASCAFMMPVATPPNAIVFGSGELTIPQMARAGIWVNAIALVLIILLIELVGPAIFGLT